MLRTRLKPPPIDLSRFAGAIRGKRGDRTLDDIAVETGLHKSTLSQIENERMVPGLEVFARLCRWLEVPMDDFKLKDEAREVG